MPRCANLLAPRWAQLRQPRPSRVVSSKSLPLSLPARRFQIDRDHIHGHCHPA